MAGSVLIVDDDPAFRTLARRIVADSGLEVVGEAETAAAAETAADSLRPDAVLVDVGLPDRDGIDLACDLYARPWSPRVVLVSSDPDVGTLARERCAADGLAETLPFVPKAELPNAPLHRLLGDG